VTPHDPAGRGDVCGVTHFWRVKKVLPERYGQPCRVLARGALNSCLVEFEDGYRVITNRWYVRRLTP